MRRRRREGLADFLHRKEETRFRLLRRTRGLARWLPMAISNEKGIRNFTDAASQSP